LTLKIKTTNDINSPIFKDALNIRLSVFVDEQGVPEELERDDFDVITDHLVGYQCDQPVTTIRIKAEADQWHIQRVATVKTARGHGYAKQLIEYSIQRATAEPKIIKLVLGAQLTAIPFYEKLGFKVIGPEFLDADILHREMELKVK